VLHSLAWTCTQEEIVFSINQVILCFNCLLNWENTVNALKSFHICMTWESKIFGGQVDIISFKYLNVCRSVIFVRCEELWRELWVQEPTMSRYSLGLTKFCAGTCGWRCKDWWNQHFTGTLLVCEICHLWCLGALAEKCQVPITQLREQRFWAEILGLLKLSEKAVLL